MKTLTQEYNMQVKQNSFEILLITIQEKLSKKIVLFKRFNKIVKKTKLNFTILKTADNQYIKVYSYHLKKAVLIYDINNNKYIKTGDFGMTNNLKENKKTFIHTSNQKLEVLNSESFDKFIKKKFLMKIFLLI